MAAWPETACAKLAILLLRTLAVVARAAPAQRGRRRASARELQADLQPPARARGPARRRLRLRPDGQDRPCSPSARRTLRPPASVEKLYTATTALALMGPAARLSTTVYGVGPARARAASGKATSTCAAAATRRSAAAASSAATTAASARASRSSSPQLVHVDGIHQRHRQRATATSPSSTRCAASPRAATRPTRSSKARSAASPSTAARTARTRRARPGRLRGARSSGRALKADGVQHRAARAARRARPPGALPLAAVQPRPPSPSCSA